MDISTKCIALIKKFEGCRLKAYKDSVGVLTIGYGLTNACKSITGLTIKSTTTITQAQAEYYLKQVLQAKYVPLVMKYNSKYNWNQNQLDALVSFTYNIGSIDGLTAKGTRSVSQISAKITAYNKAGGKVLAGLTNRRKAEKELFDTPVATATVSGSYVNAGVNYAPVFDPTYYANKYSDLKAVYGYNASQLFAHFINYGMKEGRQAIATFNVNVYRARYTDLQDAFGTNLPAYYRHYCTNGISEGRKAV